MTLQLHQLSILRTTARVTTHQQQQLLMTEQTRTVRTPSPRKARDNHLTGSTERIASTDSKIHILRARTKTDTQRLVRPLCRQQPSRQCLRQPTLRERPQWDRHHRTEDSSITLTSQL